MRIGPTKKRIFLYSGLAVLSIVAVFATQIIEHNRADFTKDGMRLGLREAVRADDPFAMRVFLLLGVDPNKRSRYEVWHSLLILAIENKSLHATKLLLDHGTFPSGAIDLEGQEIEPALWDRGLLAYAEVQFHRPAFDALDDPLVQAALRNEKGIFELLRVHGAPYGIVAAIAMNDESFARAELEKNQDTEKAIRDISWEFVAIASAHQNKAAADLLHKLGLVASESEQYRHILVQ